jgi:hypothetical protein
MEPNTPSRQLEVIGRLSRWGRNAGHDLGDQTDRMAVIISEAAGAADWLGDPRTGLLREDTLVLTRESRAGRAVPRTRGTWLGYRGALTEPGDEIAIGDLWLQVTDYASLRYLTVTGATLVRLHSTEDVAAYLADVRQARTTGTVPDVLLHPALELADRCALAAGAPCTAAGLGGRLFVAADETVRTMPGGVVVGESVTRTGYSPGRRTRSRPTATSASTDRWRRRCGPPTTPNWAGTWWPWTRCG